MPKGIWAQGQRKNTMEWIKGFFIQSYKKGLAIDRLKFSALISMELGCTQMKAVEYLNDLKLSGYIEEEDGLLYPSDREMKKLEKTGVELTDEEITPLKE